MKTRRYMYGSLGLLSLLGLIGIFTEAKSFLAFFAFVVDFEYLFMESDEMLEQVVNRSASRAFYLGMVSVALVCFFGGLSDERQALMTGLGAGWAVAVVVYALSTAYYGFRERWGLERDSD